MQIIEKIVSKPLKTFSIVACLHGNELIGKEIIKKLEIKNANLICVIANEEAIKENKRYIEQDLNRCFPGNENGMHEERLAKKILAIVKNSDYILDIHSTTAETEDFAITTKYDKEFVEKLALKKVVIMNKELAKGKSLIDNVNKGISIEFCNKTTIEKATKLIEETINNILNNKNYEKEYYYAYALETKKNKVRNFQKTTMQGEEFYPIFYGAKAYTNISYIKTKKI